MSVIEKAKSFAIAAHGDQMYGKFKYEVHLAAVATLLQDFHMEDAVIASGWLHDTLEDTDVTFDVMLAEFGSIITGIVFACTNEPGKNRRERHEKSYPKLRMAGKDAVAVKLADHIANVQPSITYSSSMFSMYRKEYAEFRKALYLPGELEDMWTRLNDIISS